MLLNKSTEYAIRLVLYLARHQSGSFMRIKEIAEDSAISYFQLGKVAQSLIRAGILESHRGPRGGVRLPKNGTDAKLYDILKAVEGTDVFERCVLGFQECGDDSPCLVHEHWKEAREVISQMFRERTVGDFVNHDSAEKMAKI